MDVDRLLADEALPGREDLTVGDFWSWAYSDVLSNANRSVFAEFLVGAALGVVSSPRVEWDAVDFRYRGHGIEVKSSAYVQSWKQTEPSRVLFGIGKKRAWHAESNKWSKTAVRSADVYVFCLYLDRSRRQRNVLDARAWEFYVTPTRIIDREVGEQKTIGLQGVKALADPVTYGNLRCTIDRVLPIS